MDRSDAHAPDTAAALTISVSPEQADQLRGAFALAKAVASPARLAILGALATRLDSPLTLDELAAAVEMAPALLERDLDRLVEAGFVHITEWAPAPAGREPRPARLAFNRAALQTTNGVITVLAQLTSQLQPAASAPAQDERARTLARFMQDGRILGLPVQFKRQVWIIEEVAKAFQPGVVYSEREVDGILKQIYAYDHCTLRRYLIDLKFMQRENGQYWRVA